MLRNRSRAVTNNKQALMADHKTSLLSPTKNPTSPITSFLGSPRFFHGFLSKALGDSESPTSILDSNNSPSFVNPFGHFDKGLSRPQLSLYSQGSTGGAIGLALISDEEGESNGSCCLKPVSRMALFGSRLKVQIPVINPPLSSSPVESPKSPADFGIKTRNSQMISSSPFGGTGSGTPPPPSRDFTRQLSLKEMEMSEDYTCVIIHGPNPKTTHIFDDCVVECCCGDDDDPSSHHNNPQPGSSQSLLSLCHTCQDILGQGKDIYMYRGKKAFCSHECSCQEMFSERNNHPSELDATL